MASRCVLVVDDEPAMLRMLVDGLCESGWEASPAEGGTDALELLRGGGFAAVVSDVRMRDGDGFSLLRSIRALGDPVPVILMSSFGSRSAESQARSAGAFAYLDKPFTLGELLEVLGRLPSPSRQEP